MQLLGLLTPWLRATTRTDFDESPRGTSTVTYSPGSICLVHAAAATASGSTHHDDFTA
jgi:hypothetical protein